jgi:hypothetical protein
MTMYYTAKDIEEMSARGIRQLEIGPGITLTDFARETAMQLDISLVSGSEQAATPAPAATASRTPERSSKYNKPSGCMHGSNSHSAAPTVREGAANPSARDTNSSTVNRLIDLMGNVMKRGE